MNQDDTPPRKPPAEWVEALEQARADVDAGRTVPLAEVVADLYASLDRMKRRDPDAA